MSTSETTQESVEIMSEYVARKEALYVTTEQEFEDAWGKFAVDGMEFAGIDCEYFTVDGRREMKKVALLQLTGPQCTVLYHIARLSSRAYREELGVCGEYPCCRTLRPRFTPFRLRVASSAGGLVAGCLGAEERSKRHW